MFHVCTYIYPKNGPNVGKYSIHGTYGHIYHKSTIAQAGSTSTAAMQAAVRRGTRDVFTGTANAVIFDVWTKQKSGINEI